MKKSKIEKQNTVNNSKIEEITKKNNDLELQLKEEKEKNKKLSELESQLKEEKIKNEALTQISKELQDKMKQKKKEKLSMSFIKQKEQEYLTTISQLKQTVTEREKEIISYKDKQNADTFRISELENEITKLKELMKGGGTPRTKPSPKKPTFRQIEGELPTDPKTIKKTSSKDLLIKLESSKDTHQCPKKRRSNKNIRPKKHLMTTRKVTNPKMSCRELNLHHLSDIDMIYDLNIKTPPLESKKEEDDVKEFGFKIPEVKKKESNYPNKGKIAIELPKPVDKEKPVKQKSSKNIIPKFLGDGENISQINPMNDQNDNDSLNMQSFIQRKETGKFNEEIADNNEDNNNDSFLMNANNNEQLILNHKKTVTSENKQNESENEDDDNEESDEDFNVDPVRLIQQYKDSDEDSDERGDDNSNIKITPILQT